METTKKKRLFGGGPVAAAPVAAAPVAAAPVAAAPTGTALAMPGFLGSPLPAVVEGGSSGAYVQLYHPMSPKAADLMVSLGSLEEGQVILHEPSKPPRKLTPLTFILLRYHQCEVQVDQSKNVLRARQCTGRYEPGWKESMDMAMIVVTADGFVPASMWCTGPAAAGAKTAAKILRAAESPEWGDRGSEYRATLTCPVTQFRVLFTWSRGRKDVGKLSGKPFYVSEVGFAPTGAQDRDLLTEWMGQEGSVDAVRDVIEALQSRVAMYEAKSK